VAIEGGGSDGGGVDGGGGGGGGVGDECVAQHFQVKMVRRNPVCYLRK
jgi:hypothetical protein